MTLHAASSREIVLLGAGGHGKVVADLSRAAGYVPVAFLDPRQELWGTNVLGVHVKGGDDHLGELVADGVVYGTVAVGGWPRLRRLLVRKLENFRLVRPTLCHPSAVIPEGVELGAGVTVHAQVAISPDVQVGPDVILNTGCIVEHEVRIGARVHVAPRATLLGEVHVADEAFIGAGAVVLPGVNIGENAVVGAGAVVTRDVSDRAHVRGVPAQAYGIGGAGRS